MTTDDTADLERRILILTPTGRDASLAERTFASVYMPSRTCKDVDELVAEMGRGAGALLVGEEALAGGRAGALVQALANQPPWSDLPLLLLTHPRADSAVVGAIVDAPRNVTLLERPVRIAALISSARTALRSRERQYQIRMYLAEREEASEGLREADRRKDEFLATLAHELRNPLAPISNSLHILRLKAEASPETQRIHEMMSRQVGHMVRLVDDLLEVSRITRGQIELRKEVVDLRDVLRAAVESARSLLDSENQKLSVDLGQTPLPAEADPARLTQIFSNLLNNASKYTPRGGHIALVARREDDAVVVTVSDNGVGIAAEMLNKVFDLFVQADSAGERGRGGLGIGLTLVKRLVQMHGGTVEARSEGAGRGSDFVVSLPLAATAAEVRREKPVATEAAPLAGCSILVVDDNVDAAASLGLLLRLIGADVRVVNDGPSALDAMAGDKPAAVLLDLGMPVMDGYEVARRIRMQARFDDVLLVALSGWGQEEDRRRSREAGFDHHLIKPANVALFREVLEPACRRKDGSCEAPP